MKFRARTIFSGHTFQVPQHIVRLDKLRTHGWQLRYGESKFFADHSNDGTGAERALREATEELGRRISTLQAPTGLKNAAFANKTTDLPLGISGPTARLRQGKNVPYYSFQVSMPRANGRSTNKSVYIGTENTITEERLASALVKAIEIREREVRAAQMRATNEKRVSAIAAGIFESNAG